MSGVQVERRCGMVTGATCRNVGLSWLPAGGRHGTRTWVLSTQNGDTTRRIRLSPNEIGALTDILRMLADGERATDAQAGQTNERNTRMTIDELIEQLRKFKHDGISGETSVIVDCYDIPDGYRSIAGLEAASRNLDDMPEDLLENSKSQFFPCVTL